VGVCMCVYTNVLQLFILFVCVCVHEKLVGIERESKACKVSIGYGVATMSRLLKMIGLFCRILSLLWVYFAKETHHFKEPTNRSHPISARDTHAISS